MHLFQNGLQETVHPVSRGAGSSCDEVNSCQVVPRHIRMTAYRCYLPVLTGFTGSYCEEPGHLRHFPPPIASRRRSLDREFDPAIADCGCRAPLPPRLARSRRNSGGDERTRTADPLVANEVLSQLSYIPTLISRVPAPFLRSGVLCLAEREGFEPSEQLPAQRFSRPPHSTSSGISPCSILYSNIDLEVIR